MDKFKYLDTVWIKDFMVYPPDEYKDVPGIFIRYLRNNKALVQINGTDFYLDVSKLIPDSEYIPPKP